jgi:hypothetical protein
LKGNWGARAGAAAGLHLLTRQASDFHSLQRQTSAAGIEEVNKGSSVGIEEANKEGIEKNS